MNNDYPIKCIECGEHVSRSEAVESKGSYYCDECAAKELEGKVLIEYIQELWDEEEAMQDMINLDHPDPDLSAFRSHEINMMRLEAIQRELERVKELEAEVLALSNRHNDLLNRMGMTH